MTVRSREQLEAECDRLREEIEQWQMASGLLVGGDPGGVEPRHLAKEMGLHSRLLSEMLNLLRWQAGTRGNPPARDAGELLAEIEGVLDAD